jgi:hypothetical protein
VAKILARRTEMPTYVGCSVDLAGPMVEEELEAVKTVIEAVLKEFEAAAGDAVNGT